MNGHFEHTSFGLRSYIRQHPNCIPLTRLDNLVSMGDVFKGNPVQLRCNDLAVPVRHCDQGRFWPTVPCQCTSLPATVMSSAFQRS